MDIARRREDAARRVSGLLAEPFGEQVLRDLVPRGRKITAAADSERIGDAVRRAVQESGGLPAFLAVDVDGTDRLTFLVIEQAGPGGVRVYRPGDSVMPGRRWHDGDTLTDYLAELRRLHGEPG